MSEKTTNLQNLLAQYEKVFDLLFMRDISHLLMHSSKEFQRFDVLPFYPMNVGEQLLSALISFAESFTEGVIPEAFPLHLHGNKTCVVWETFKSVTQKILESGEFKGAKLLLPHERGRVTRLAARYGDGDSALQNMFQSKMKVYGEYIHRLVEQFLIRFYPWPVSVTVQRCL